MKLLTLLLVLFSFQAAEAQNQTNPFERGRAARESGEGGVQGGGGDPVAELLIKNIRDDLMRWVKAGGAAGLKFNGRLTQKVYESGAARKPPYGMIELLTEGSVTVNVIREADHNEGDELKNTVVAGVRKVCKGVYEAKKDRKAYLICDHDLFMKMAEDPKKNQDLQYTLVHHEYASLAGLEVNILSDSQYDLSKQIVKWMGNETIDGQTVRRLIAGENLKYRKMSFVTVPAKGAMASFEMQTTSVNQEQWIALMGFNPSTHKTLASCDDTFSEKNGGYCPNHPVEQITFTEICGDFDRREKPEACGRDDGFVKAMNDLNDGCIYRLPTAAEWEHAALGGTEGPFAFGSNPKLVFQYAWVNERADMIEGGSWGSQTWLTGTTHQVATKKANGYGLYDMVGNVANWVFDIARPETLDNSRVVKGSHYATSLIDIAVAKQYDFEPTQQRVMGLGFRLVRSCR